MNKQIITMNVVFAFLLVFSSLQCSKDKNPVVENNIGNNTITWNTVFSDNFQRADGPNIGNYSVQVGCDGNGVASISNVQLKFAGSGCWAIRDSSEVAADTVRVSVAYTIVAGNPGFGIAAKSKNLGNNWVNQEFYLFAADFQGIKIYRCQGTTPVVLISKSYNIQTSHTYKLQLMTINKDLTGYIQDLAGGPKDSLNVTDNGSLLKGTIVSFNGYDNAITDTLLLDDFKIETGK